MEMKWVVQYCGVIDVVGLVVLLFVGLAEMDVSKLSVGSVL